MTTTRDPVSVLFDTGAAELLRRAYAAGRGTWAGTRLGDPGPQTRLWLISLGVDWQGPDAPAVADPAARGGLDCKDRWTRAFVRALYYQHRWYSGGDGPRAGRRLTANRAGALQVDVGRRLPPLGIFPAGRAVRIRVLQGGRNAIRASARHGDQDRIFNAYGEPLGARASSIEYQDWRG